jgi:hypothetical protein
MGINNCSVDKTGETATEFQGSDKSTGLGNVKTIIADKLHEAAEALDKKASDKDAHSGVAQYGKQASEWDRSRPGYSPGCKLSSIAYQQDCATRGQRAIRHRS